MRNAPPVLAPRLEVVFGQPTAHCLPGDAVMLGEPDQFIRQQLQGPTGATLRWVGTGGRDQQGFLFARELAGRARTRLFTQRLFQIAHQEAALGPVHGRPAHADADRDVLVAGARVGSQQNLRALELARRMLAAAQERREFAALGLAEFDAVAYSSVPPRGSRHKRTAGSDVRRMAPAKSFTPKQGQYLAFIYAYNRSWRRPPAEADMQQYFRVSPPSVHQMVLTLERAGFIRRQPGVARNIEILVDPEHLPVLR